MCCLSSCLDNYYVINFKIYVRSSSEAMTDRENMREDGIQTFEYVEYEKNFLDEIKAFFIVFEGLKK